MTTYANLEQDLISWTLNNDLPTQTLIRLTEDDFNRRLRTTEQLTTTSMVVTTQTQALPTGFLQFLRVSIDTTFAVLDYMTPERFYESNAYRQAGKPQIFTIEGNNIVFAPGPSPDVTVLMAYYQRFPALTPTNDTNWVSQNAYDLYLYGTLTHAAPYIEEDNRISLWNAAYERAIERLQQQDERKKYGGSSLKRIPAFSP